MIFCSLRYLAAASVVALRRSMMRGDRPKWGRGRSFLRQRRRVKPLRRAPDPDAQRLGA
jgi:hypothetical protein